jgi:predicted GIY-YIG superfamily endonuclease
MSFRAKREILNGFDEKLLCSFADQLVMYVGVTNDLKRRIHEHKNKLITGFSNKYNLNKLFYFEMTEDIHSAIAREKKIRR